MTKLKFLSAINPESKKKLAELDQKLSEFYNSEKAKEYWIKADQANYIWQPQTHPYHLHLKSFIRKESSVVELGCGSGHAYRNLKDLAVRYTGVDWSNSQVEKNQLNYPDAEFISSSVCDISLPSKTFDLSLSLFTLEHVVYPHLYLQEMYRLVKPNGLIAIICPDFRTNGRMNSFVYGTSCLELREKISKGRFWDALLHLYEREFAFPREIESKYRFNHQNKQFLIYPNPKCLDGKYYSDTDAVYFVGQNEIEEYMKYMGCKILATPSKIDGRSNQFSLCYLVAQKQGV
jgi:ubiquinone/menaquinone biosynthesis C-methylase UbiE